MTTEFGVVHEFDVIVTAVGMLDVPNIPDIPGAEGFRGRAFHSSNWDHLEIDCGRAVVCIGTRAPAPSRRSGDRSGDRAPHRVPTHPDLGGAACRRAVHRRAAGTFAREPGEARKLRDKAFEDYEAASFGVDSEVTKYLTKVSNDYLMAKVADPDLRAKLLPDYPVGCKRPLQSRTWFPTFALPNVSLETSPIARFTERGLVTADGAEHEADTVIYGTGFRAADYLCSLEVYGSGGRRLRDDWRDGAEAYLGTTVPGYPNLFTLYGPNTNGVTSIIYIEEAQAEFVRRVLDHMVHRSLEAIEVRREVHDDFQCRNSGRDARHGVDGQLQQLLPPSQREGGHPVPVQRTHLHATAGAG